MDKRLIIESINSLADQIHNDLIESGITKFEISEIIQLINLNDELEKMRNVYCIGDLHYKVENLGQHDELYEMIEDDLNEIEEPIDFIVVMGDSLHTHERVHSTVLNKLTDFLLMLSRHATTYVLTGNHDFINNKQFLNENHSLYPLKHLKSDRLIIVDREIIQKDEFLFVPYVPDGRFHEALNTISSEKLQQCRIIFAHQLIDGASLPIGPAKDVERWDDERIVFSGHIHGFQIVSYPDGEKNNPSTPKWCYVGACRQVAINESIDRKGPLLLQIPNEYNSLNDIKKTRTELGLSILHSITISSLEEFENADMTNVTHVIVKMKKENVEVMKKSTKYNEFKNNCRFVFRSIEEDSNEIECHNAPIDELLRKKIDLLDDEKMKSMMISYVQG